jgi:hypothetical protein
LPNTAIRSCQTLLNAPLENLERGGSFNQHPPRPSP